MSDVTLSSNFCRLVRFGQTCKTVHSIPALKCTTLSVKLHDSPCIFTRLTTDADKSSQDSSGTSQGGVLKLTSCSSLISVPSIPRHTPPTSASSSRRRHQNLPRFRNFSTKSFLCSASDIALASARVDQSFSTRQSARVSPFVAGSPSSLRKPGGLLTCTKKRTGSKSSLSSDVVNDQELLQMGSA